MVPFPIIYPGLQLNGEYIQDGFGILQECTGTISFQRAN